VLTGNRIWLPAVTLPKINAGNAVKQQVRGHSKEQMRSLRERDYDGPTSTGNAPCLRDKAGAAYNHTNDKERRYRQRKPKPCETKVA
jgi:hypothetical protein